MSDSMPLLSEPAIKAALAAENGYDYFSRYVLCIVIATLGLYYAFPALTTTGIILAVLPLSTLLLWTVWITIVVLSLLTILLSMLLLMPTQLLPVRSYQSEIGNKDLLLVAFAITTLCHFLFWYNASSVALIGDTLLFIVLVGGGYGAGIIRRLVAQQVISKLLLPSTSVLDQVLTTQDGRRVQAREAWYGIRRRFLAVGTSGQLVSPWVNVTVAGGKQVRLDAAYIRHHTQASLAPEQQKWILCLGGNGEVYEFGLPEFAGLSADSGANVMVFNYRTVGASEGELSSGYDLIEDCMLMLAYLEEHLSAPPGNVLLLGRSIGGAVAALARASHSPHGPLVSDRSFSSLGDAATGIFNRMFKGITGVTSFSIPGFVVKGLLASVFKGRLDTVRVWSSITGSKMIIYHTDDQIITYDVSLHNALGAKANQCTVFKLSNLPQGEDLHNSPLKHFPEYAQVVPQWRAMLSITGELDPDGSSFLPSNTPSTSSG